MKKPVFAAAAPVSEGEGLAALNALGGRIGWGPGRLAGLRAGQRIARGKGWPNAAAIARQAWLASRQAKNTAILTAEISPAGQPSAPGPTYWDDFENGFRAGLTEFLENERDGGGRQPARFPASPEMK